MSYTITVRLTDDLAKWLEATAAGTRISQGQLMREQIEKANAADGNPTFMRLAGCARGPRDLSRRKGFSK